MSVCPGPWTACFTWGLEMFPAQVALVLKVCQFSEFYCDIETRRTRGIFVLETRMQQKQIILLFVQCFFHSSVIKGDHLFT